MQQKFDMVVRTLLCRCLSPRKYESTVYIKRLSSTQRVLFVTLLLSSCQCTNRTLNAPHITHHSCQDGGCMVTVFVTTIRACLLTTSEIPAKPRLWPSLSSPSTNTSTHPHPFLLNLCTLYTPPRPMLHQHEPDSRSPYRSPPFPRLSFHASNLKPFGAGSYLPKVVICVKMWVYERSKFSREAKSRFSQRMAR